jgi:fused signal recognition particle receptor
MKRGPLIGLRAGLRKTRDVLSRGIERLRNSTESEREEALDELEETLIQADIGVHASQLIRQRIEERFGNREPVDHASIQSVLREQLEGVLKGAQSHESTRFGKTSSGPEVILVAGVNGSGKTTSIGKLAYRYMQKGHRVLLGAADTFRAAATEQLTVWARRSGADIISQKPGADPASVAYDTVSAAQARGHSVVILDTAGRLQTKVNLMNELTKIDRVVAKALPGAPHQKLLVIDATVGQNAISQARLFNAALDVTGILLAKVDGTAKGGVVVPIIHDLGIPVLWLGVGEGMDDLQPFSTDTFIDALISP